MLKWFFVWKKHLKKTNKITWFILFTIPLFVFLNFYHGGIMPPSVSHFFQGLEFRWYNFQMRRSIGELLTLQGMMDAKVSNGEFEINSTNFNTVFDQAAVLNKAPKDIAILAIDEKTLTELDEWPIRRDAYSKMIENLMKAGARLVVFDIVFSEKGDQLPIEKLKELSTFMAEDLQKKVSEAISDLDYDARLIRTFKDYRLNIVAGFSALKGDEAVVKKEENNIFDGKHIIYGGAKADVIDSVDGVDGGIYNYKEIRESLRYRGYFNVKVDPVDGNVREVYLLSSFPVKIRDGKEVQKEKKVLFGSMSLEAYSQMMGGLQRNPHFDYENFGHGFIHVDVVKRLKLRSGILQTLKEDLRKNVLSVEGLSNLQKDFLGKICDRVQPFSREYISQIFLVFAKYSAGILNWSDSPDKGFLREFSLMEDEIKMVLLGDLEEGKKRKILENGDFSLNSPYIQELRHAYDKLSDALFEVAIDHMYGQFFNEVMLLRSISDEEFLRLKIHLRKGMEKDPKWLLSLFQSGNFEDYSPSVVMNSDGSVRIRFRASRNGFVFYSFSDVLDSGKKLRGKFMGYPTREMSLEEAFKNKIVLLGPTAIGVNDWRNTPIISNMDGVEVHANALAGLIYGDNILRYASAEVTEISIILLLAVILPVALLSMNALLGALFTALVIFLYWFFCDFYFAANVYFYFMPILLQCVMTYILLNSYSYILEERERKKTRNAFQHYVNASVVDAVLQDPDMLKLGGQKREMTVLFSDVRGFTTISEALDPVTLVALMNEYLTEMTDLVLKYDGTLDKFIGDAVMAFWGAPITQENHYDLGVKTAIEMNKKLDLIRPEFYEKYKVDVRIGVGINTGPMVVGNMGSSSRFNYTVIGDAVNLGARLEGQTKNYGADLIISQSTYQYVKDWAATRFLDLIAVKGKSEPVAIYECIGYKSEMDAKTLEGLAKFNEAVQTYYLGRRFAEGITFFEDLKKYRKGKDKACDLYIDRCRDFLENPPDKNWTGVFVATSK